MNAWNPGAEVEEGQNTKVGFFIPRRVEDNGGAGPLFFVPVAATFSPRVGSQRQLNPPTWQMCSNLMI